MKLSQMMHLLSIKHVTINVKTTQRYAQAEWKCYIPWTKIHADVALFHKYNLNLLLAKTNLPEYS